MHTHQKQSSTWNFVTRAKQKSSSSFFLTSSANGIANKLNVVAYFCIFLSVVYILCSRTKWIGNLWSYELWVNDLLNVKASFKPFAQRYFQARYDPSNGLPMNQRCLSIWRLLRLRPKQWDIWRGATIIYEFIEFFPNKSDTLQI